MRVCVCVCVYVCVCVCVCVCPISIPIYRLNPKACLGYEDHELCNGLHYVILVPHRRVLCQL